MKLIVVLLLFSVCFYSEAKHFSRCGLVRELRRQGFPEDKMRNWVCLVEAESSRRTDVVGRPSKKDGSRAYGLYQINDRYWCSNTNIPGKGCNVTCKALLTDDITAASTCAKKIFRRQGFKAWTGWVVKCQGPLPDISNC
ncbi:lysozyme-like [Epargyreus clarus]|uniref:lysozyme-like n=1 Tax=Epargyreus clarus TaxID=520877 RepID=UPI003C2D0521